MVDARAGDAGHRIHLWIRVPGIVALTWWLQAPADSSLVLNSTKV